LLRELERQSRAFYSESGDKPYDVVAGSGGRLQLVEGCASCPELQEIVSGRCGANDEVVGWDKQKAGWYLELFERCNGDQL
jgi:hypothetical protein